MVHIKEKVFANFSSQQAKDYQDARGRYPARVYEEIIKYHRLQTNLVVDVGCGPGNGTRDLVPYFDQVIGLDASPAMIDAARELTAPSMADRLSFANLSAENIGEAPGVEPGTVDMVTSATAAHWFDLPAFYTAAHRALRPGGTMAIWVTGLPSIHPDQPHAAEIVSIIAELRQAIAPYRQTSATSGSKANAGDANATSMYKNLPLPWTCDPPVDGFRQESFERIVLCDENGNQAMPGAKMRISDGERRYGSGSPIIRWREQHPELAGTDQDIVKSRFNKIRELLGADDAEIAVNMQFAILLWRKDE